MAGSLDTGGRILAERSRVDEGGAVNPGKQAVTAEALLTSRVESTRAESGFLGEIWLFKKSSVIALEDSFLATCGSATTLVRRALNSEDSFRGRDSRLPEVLCNSGDAYHSQKKWPKPATRRSNYAYMSRKQTRN